MAIPPFYIKQHDRQPYYYAQVVDADGDPVDLAGASFKTTMKQRDGTLKIDQSLLNVNVTSEVNGDFEYQWSGSDTNTVGKNYIEFEVTPGSGGKFTVPANPDERAEVWVMKSLDTS